MKKAFIVKVEGNEIVIPKEKLNGIKEGDIVEIIIEKVYASRKTIKNLPSF